MNNKELQELTEWVRGMLREWDPIRVSQWAEDEYDSYAPKIASLLMTGADKVKLSKHLFQLEANAMGLSGDRTRCDDIATRLSEGFSAKCFRRR